MTKRALFFLLSTLLLALPAQAQTVSNTVRITWSDNSLNEEGFRIYHHLGGIVLQNPPGAIATVGPDVTSFDHQVTGQAGLIACYAVTAFNAAGESLKSNTDCVTLTVPPAPPPPSEPPPPPPPPPSVTIPIPPGATKAVVIFQ